MKNKGFTLIEVAIVLVIVGFLLSTVLGGLSAQREVAKIKEDQVGLKQIKSSLLSFVAVNGYLPCPDTDGDGVENRDANQRCTDVDGDLPFLTLSGIGDKDAYGGAFFYAVNRNADTNEVLQMCQQASYFGREGVYDPNPDLDNCSITGQDYCAGDCVTAAGGNCEGGACPDSAGIRLSLTAPYYRYLTPPLGVFNAADGSLLVCNENETSGSCSGATPNAEIAARSIAAVVVSYGANGSETRASCNNASIAERENCDGDRFFHRDNSIRGQFDDVLIWISPNEIKQIAIESGKNLSVR